MKVYCVIGEWDYEGYDEPEGIFSKKEEADALAEELERQEFKYHNVSVIEYELDIVRNSL